MGVEGFTVAFERFIGFNPFRQHFIIEEAARAEGFIEQYLLVGGWIESYLESPLDIHRFILTYLCVKSKQSLQQIVSCFAALYPHALEKKAGVLRRS
jgi:hypothetical protein